MVVDTTQYLDMVSDLLREGRQQVAVTVAGSSMVPFLHHGDKVYLDPLPEVLKAGAKRVVIVSWLLQQADIAQTAQAVISEIEKAQ